MIIDSHAHVSPSYDSLQDWDFDTEPELWAYHQSTNFFHHKPVATTASGAAAQNWPRFRGPNGSGVSESRGLPVEFGPGKNLAWRIAVPAGHSSPVVWENRVFLTGYEESRCIVVCLDQNNGRRLWERSIEATRVERKSKPNDAASSTPAADETGIYSLFSGFGLVAFSHDGQERWRRPLGPFTPPHGMASSLVLAAGTVVVVADQVSDSCIAAFESASGKWKWKTPRPNLVGGYATPVLHGTDILTGGPMEMVAYAVDTGERREAMLAHLLDEPRNVARIGDQHVLRSERHEDEAVRGQREDVIERQRGEDYLRLGRQERLKPRA